MRSDVRIPWLKLVLWAALIHLILIALSILEVIIYSTLIAPGMEQTHYEQHAQITAPWISIIMGIVLFFFIVRRLSRRQFDKSYTIALTLPAIYIVMDLVIMLLSATDWSEQYGIFIISFVTKMAASLFGAFTLKK